MPHIFILLQAVPGGPLGPYIQFVPFVAVGAILYFMYLRPMQRQQQTRKQMLTGLQNGQTVLTTGGIIGTIVVVNDDTLILRIKPDNLKLQVSRNAVASVLGSDDPGKK